MIGQTISHYRVLEKLGEGGMGLVYKARDTRLDRIVAIKVLLPEKVADTERKQRFVQEAKAASSLNHPNIITIYDIGQVEGIDFISMEYVNGKTLDRLIPRHGMRLNEALKCAVQIADALARAHSAGIVHRDLKPGNIMVNEHGLVKVLDFGLAKLTESTPTEENESTRTMRPTTEEGKIVGTVAYMSPEQAEGKKVDARSDIFSFGSVVYEMVTGRQAFHGDTKASTLAAILKDNPRPTGQLVDGLPREVERLIERCLRKEVNQRSQHMDDVKIGLQELKEESDSGVLGKAPVIRPKPRRRLAWALGVAAALVIAMGGVWLVRSKNELPEVPLVAVPLTTYPGFEGEPSFSPDGNQVAFVWNGEKQDNSDIYVKLIGTTGPPLRLTTDPASDYNPAWSPDGRYIASLRDLPNGKAAVLLVPALGGPERKVGEVFSRGLSLEGQVTGPYLSWSPDGNSLVVSDKDSLKDPWALSLLSVETSEKRKLTSPPAQMFGDSGPAFSPDGRMLAFTRIVDAGISDLYLLAFSDRLKALGEPRQVTFGNRAAISPAWSADGREVIFSSWIFVRYPGLWRVVIPSLMGPPAEPQRLTSLGENIFDPAISLRGRRLTYAHRLFHASIGRIAASGAGTSSARGASSARPLIFSTRDDLQPQFSPDGRRIAFVSTRSGNSEIWVCNSDGSNAVQLTSFGGPFVTTPRWSPDGEKIAFDSNAGGEFDIYVIGVNGGKVQRMTTHPANNGNPSWSRDGHWIYFDSARTGEQRVFKIPADGGEAIQVTQDGGFAPLESPDGKFLYYTKALFATTLWKVPIEGGQATKILEGLSSYISLAIVNGGVYFVPLQRPSSIQFLSFTTNQIRPVSSLEKPIEVSEVQGGGLAVSPDGRWILCTQFDQAGSELMLVENFR